MHIQDWTYFKTNKKLIRINEQPTAVTRGTAGIENTFRLPGRGSPDHTGFH